MQLQRVRTLLGPIAPQVEGAGDLGVLLSAASAFALLLLLPRVADDRLPDLRPLDAGERKAEFFALLDPIIENLGTEIAEQRAFVDALAEEIAEGRRISWLDRRRLDALADYYEVPMDGADLATEVLPQLKRRIDIVPRSLILIQAAVESGWGTSRFAVRGNNLFGQRCYVTDCGLEPAGVDDPDFYVAAFGSVEQSVASYVRNLNTHPRYREFRRVRGALRAEDRSLDGMVLADSLQDYSERGDDYVQEIKQMIAENDLEPFD